MVSVHGWAGAQVEHAWRVGGASRSSARLEQGEGGGEWDGVQGQRRPRSQPPGGQ